jgi:hypothetical protein
MTEIPASMTGSPQRSTYSQPLLRGFAQVISWLFHPLFISAYVIGFLIFLHPSAFEGFNRQDKVFRFLNVLLVNTFFPLFSVFLCWRLQFIRSMYLKTARDRIIPYMIAMIFYFWTWWVYHNLADVQPAVPPSSVHFLLGAFLAICFAWMCNIYYKISMHAVAMGGVIMFFYQLAFSDNYSSGVYLSVAVLAAGVVCTARLICSDHTRFEIWSGLIVGLMAQWVAWQF